MGRRILAITAAAVIALIGAVLVLLYARGADARAVEAASPTTAYVSSLAIPAGRTMKEAVRLKELTQTQVPAASLPAGALTTVDDSNSALVALNDIPTGQIVLAAAFGEVPTGEQALQVGAGKLAVSVQLADPARVGTFLRPGSQITVFMTYKLKQLDSSADAKAFNDQDVKGTSVLLDNVKVLATGDQSLTPPQPTEGEGTQQPANAPGFLVTLEVNPEQSVRLVHAINQYILYAGLRGSELKVNPRLSVNDQTMLGDAVK
jgi:pilus assembly protein CpaB